MSINESLPNQRAGIDGSGRLPTRLLLKTATPGTRENRRCCIGDLLF